MRPLQVHRQTGYYLSLVQRALGGHAMSQEQLSQDQIGDLATRHGQQVCERG
jgi:hypothetical protein